MFLNYAPQHAIDVLSESPGVRKALNKIRCKSTQQQYEINNLNPFEFAYKQIKSNRFKYV
jgi:hypothetical protein